MGQGYTQPVCRCLLFPSPSTCLHIAEWGGGGRGEESSDEKRGKCGGMKRKKGIKKGEKETMDETRGRGERERHRETHTHTYTYTNTHAHDQNCRKRIRGKDDLQFLSLRIMFSRVSHSSLPLPFSFSLRRVVNCYGYEVAQVLHVNHQVVRGGSVGVCESVSVWESGRERETSITPRKCCENLKAHQIDTAR